MFSKLGSDLVGTSDNCVCIPRSRFLQEERLVSTLIPGEIAFIYLKAPKEEHVITDRAYIVIQGESATGVKRLVTRFPFSEYPISNVRYETAGMGITDSDCELKFFIAGQSISIDVVKKELDIVKTYYKALVVLSEAQSRNARIFKIVTDAYQKMDVKLSETQDPGAAAAAFNHFLFAQAEQTADRYAPVSYAHVLSSVLAE